LKIIASNKKSTKKKKKNEGKQRIYIADTDGKHIIVQVAVATIDCEKLSSFSSVLPLIFLILLLRSLLRERKKVTKYE